MEKSRILIIEDAPDVANLLNRGLTEEGFETEVASDGQTALRRATEPWNLVILDLMLPDVTGEEILDFIVQKMDHPAVLVLTARDRLDDKLALFRKGCDDYLVKPFAFEELLSRVRALLRRPPRQEEKLEYGEISLEPTSFSLMRGKNRVTLTPKEFALCRRLMSEPGKVISRREILHSVWGLTHEPKTNYIDVHVTNLRKKMSAVGAENWLHALRGTGLMLLRPEGKD